MDFVNFILFVLVFLPMAGLGRYLYDTRQMVIEQEKQIDFLIRDWVRHELRLSELEGVPTNEQ